MKRPVRTIIYFILFLAVAGIIAGLYLYNMPHRNVAKAKPDYVMTADALRKEFESNEAAATAKYGNKILELTGTVMKVNVKEGKVISITLRTGNDLSSVICELGEGVDPGQVQENQIIKIRGELSGYLMDVLLNNCVILKKD